jgi:hypothetical protein
MHLSSLWCQRRHAENIKDFCPISLFDSMYKLLAKVLANRLKTVLSKLVSNSHYASVEGETNPRLELLLPTNV